MWNLILQILKFHQLVSHDRNTNILQIQFIFREMEFFPIFLDLVVS